MTFIDSLRRKPVLLAEGSVIERLRRDPTARLDPHVLNAGLLYREFGRAQLSTIYRQYLDIGQTHDLPMLVHTPTWRANPERLRAAGHGDRDVNGDAVRFMAGLRAGCGLYAERVYIGGLVGCRGDAYRPAEALSPADAHRFHGPQVKALCAGGVDFLLAATLPAVSEALGLARAMADGGCPYLLSFVVRPAGTWLDGTPLDEAVRQIDTEVSPPPTAYMVNCAHPTVFAAAVGVARGRSAGVLDRVIGLQANTSLLTPEELDSRPDLDRAAPDAFADEMVAVHRRFETRILGGCCGTDDRHMRCLAVRLARA